MNMGWYGSNIFRCPAPHGKHDVLCKWAKWRMFFDPHQNVARWNTWNHSLATSKLAETESSHIDLLPEKLLHRMWHVLIIVLVWAWSAPSTPTIELDKGSILFLFRSKYSLQTPEGLVLHNQVCIYIGNELVKWHIHDASFLSNSFAATSIKQTCEQVGPILPRMANSAAQSLFLNQL